MKRLFLVIVFLYLFLLYSCGGGGGGGKGKIAQEEQTVTRSVIITSEGNETIPAIITLGLDKNSDGLFSEDEIETISTDATGYASLQFNSTDSSKSILFRVESSGHMPFIRSFSSFNQIPNFISLKKTQKAHISVNGTNVTLQTDNVTMSIPAERIVRAYKKSYKKEIDPRQIPSNIIAEVGFLDPGRRPDAMPGNFMAYDNGTIMLSSSGVFQVEITDRNTGMPLDLGEGNYTFKMKVSPYCYAGLEDTDPSTDDVEIPLWWFDKDEGIWKRYDSLGYLVYSNGTRVKNYELADLISSGADLYIVGSVNHLTIVNCDIPTRPTSISGKINNVDENNPGYVEATGNYVGQGGGPVNPDGTFTCPVPTNPNPPSTTDEEDEKAKEKSECPKASREMVLDFFKYLKEGGYYNDVPPECWDQFNNLKLQLIDWSMRVSNSFHDVAWDPNLNFSQTDRESISNLASAFFKDVINENYDLAIDKLNKMEKFFIDKDISAEGFARMEKELFWSMVKGIAQTLADGIIAVLNIDLKAGCLNPAAETALKTGLSKLNNFILRRDPGIDLAVDAINTVSSSYIGLVDPDFVECVEKLGGTAAKEALVAAAKNIALAASVGATAIASYLDFKEHQNEVETAIAQSNLDNSLHFASIQLAHIIRSTISEECFPLSSMFTNVSIPDQCSAYKSFVQGLLPETRKINDRNTTRSKQQDDEDISEALWIMKNATDVLKTVIDVAVAVESLSGSNATVYTKWIDPETGEEVDPDPSEIEGDINRLGRYISKLVYYPYWPNILIRKEFDTTSLGINAKMIPSPGFYGYKISPWIGELDYTPPALENVTIDVNFQIEGLENTTDISIEPIEGRLAGYFSSYYTLGTFPCSCEAQSRFATRCVCSIPEDVDIVPRFYIRFQIKKDNVPLQELSRSARIEKQDLEDNHAAIDISIAATSYFKLGIDVGTDSFEPNKTYTFRAVIAPVFKNVKAKQTGNFTVRWYVNRYSIGEGQEITFTTPDKSTLYKISSAGRLWVSASLLGENNKTLDSASTFAPVNIPNSPPVIEEIEGPDTLGTFQSRTKVYGSFRVISHDPDNDKLLYRWYVKGGDYYTTFSQRSSNETIVYSTAFNQERELEICCRVSDGIDSVDSCKKVTVPKANAEPILTLFTVSPASGIVPFNATFQFQGSDDDGISKYVLDFGCDGNPDYASDNNTFTYPFTENGTYLICGYVEDTAGLKSCSRVLSVTAYRFEVDLNPQARITYYGDKFYLVVDPGIPGSLRTYIRSYGLDFDGDNSPDYYFLSNTTAIISLDSIENRGAIGLHINTLYGSYTGSISEVEPYVNVTANETSGYVPLHVAFSVDAQGWGINPVNYQFDFDGDGVFDQTSANPQTSYTYNAEGSYLVTIRTNFSDGTYVDRHIHISVFSQEAGKLTINFPFKGAIVAIHSSDLTPIDYKFVEDSGSVTFNTNEPVTLSITITPETVVNKDQLFAMVLNENLKLIGLEEANYALENGKFHREAASSILDDYGINATMFDENSDGFIDKDELYSAFVTYRDSDNNGEINMGELEGVRTISTLLFTRVEPGEYTVSMDLFPSELGYYRFSYHDKFAKLTITDIPQGKLIEVITGSPNPYILNDTLFFTRSGGSDTHILGIDNLVNGTYCLSIFDYEGNRYQFLKDLTAYEITINATEIPGPEKTISVTNPVEECWDVKLYGKYRDLWYLLSTAGSTDTIGLPSTEAFSSFLYDVNRISDDFTTSYGSLIFSNELWNSMDISNLTSFDVNIEYQNNTGVYTITGSEASDIDYFVYEVDWYGLKEDEERWVKLKWYLFNPENCTTFTPPDIAEILPDPAIPILNDLMNVDRSSSYYSLSAVDLINRGITTSDVERIIEHGFVDTSLRYTNYSP